MPAYWIARARVNDPDEYKKYAEQVPGILESYGARVLARGGDFRILEGPDTFARFVVIEFPTLEDGVACFESEAYQSAAGYRRGGAGVVEIVMVDGFAAP